MLNKKDLYSALPIYGVGKVKLSPIEFDMESGIVYHKNHLAICSGLFNRDGDLCKLACQDNEMQEKEKHDRHKRDYGHNRGKDIFKNQKYINTHGPGPQGASHHHEFKCSCVTDDKGREFCFWLPKEPVWENPRTCNSDIVKHDFQANKFRIQKLNPWVWKSVGGTTKVDAKTQVLWENALKMYKNELFDDGRKMSLALTNHLMRSAGADESMDNNAFNWVNNEAAFNTIGYLDVDTNIIDILIEDHFYIQTINEIGHFVNLARFRQLSIQENEEYISLKKTRHLLEVLTYLSSKNNIGSTASHFFNYGCYCSSFQTKDPIAQGHGNPADTIDKSCHKNTRCRLCGKLDYGKTCGSLSGYNMEILHDNNGEATISCTSSNSNDTCSLSMCECDRQMLEEFLFKNNIYDMALSHEWGGFNTNLECGYDLCRSMPQGCQKATKCCGDSSDRSPCEYE